VSNLYPHILGMRLAVSNLYPHILGMRLAVSNLYPHILGMRVAVSNLYPHILGMRLAVSNLYPHILGMRPSCEQPHTTALISFRILGLKSIFLKSVPMTQHLSPTFNSISRLIRQSAPKQPSETNKQTLIKELIIT